ncbi:hypothetical protein R3P38DRAFT_3079281 [Favolaschia claudopus]|uniref:Transposase n=1 Tax=Favolaschia claudopus TaxID=2862362 RepID=A0AAV9ZX61_9AGAR
MRSQSCSTPGGRAHDVLAALCVTGNGIASSLGPRLVDLLSNPPPENRINTWFDLTSTPFDCFESATQTSAREVACPKCRVVNHVPYLTENGTGYLQQTFSVQCAEPSCRHEITGDGLGLRKLVNDLTRETKGISDLLAGTVHTSTNVRNVKHAASVKAAMLRDATLKRPGSKTGVVFRDAVYADLVMERARYKMDKLKARLTVTMEDGGGHLINRILSAYVDDKMFSVDLILRQGSFVAKMHDLQWTKPGFFDSPEDETALQHVIVRYHAFLDLMSSSPASFFVPTLDIDLAWHTHQLMAENYAKDTMKYVGRFIDHDDLIEEHKLANAFVITCRAWKTRFGIQYTHCGCPLPSDTIGQRLSRLARPISLAPSRDPSYLIPPDCAHLRAATHPSDHNAVYVDQRKTNGEALPGTISEGLKARCGVWPSCRGAARCSSPRPRSDLR